MFPSHVATAVSVGAYMEPASLAAFAVLAAWLFRSRGGSLSRAGMLSAGVSIAVTVVGLVLDGVLQHGATYWPRAGDQSFDVMIVAPCFEMTGQASTVVPTTWARRRSWRSSTCSQASTSRVGESPRPSFCQLVALAAPTAGPSQFPNMLFLLRIVAASAALSRQPAALSSGAPATAQGAKQSNAPRPARRGRSQLGTHDALTRDRKEEAAANEGGRAAR